MTDIRSAALAAVGAAVLSAGALAQFEGEAIPTIFLPFINDSTAMNIAWHPGFKQYYGSGGGWPGIMGHVWDADGKLIQADTPVNIDVRAFNYNPNTGMLEVMQYGATDGYNGGGRWNVLLDDKGFFTGENKLLVETLKHASDQSMPAYDPKKNVFYSREEWGSAVYIVDADTGDFLGTIELDLGAAGVAPDWLSYAANSYDSKRDWLVYTDWMNQRALMFDTNGKFLGSNKLGVEFYSYYGAGGIANDQLFVFTGEGWQGFALVPSPGAAATLGLAALAASRRRRG